MIYGAYKNSRNAAWQCLIDYKINRLPVKTQYITSSAEIKIYKNSDVKELLSNESGASILDGKQWIIIYNDNNPLQRSRFTIAHELGHIFLGHKLKDGYHSRTFDIDKPIVESEADIFASRLLAPACVLWGLGLKTAGEIAKVCDISAAAAQIRAERMKLLYARNKFLTSPLERKVFEQFKPFIDDFKG